MKTKIVHVRIDRDQLTRLAELEAETGMNTSDVMRALLASARLEPKPMPVAVLEVAPAAERETP